METGIRLGHDAATVEGVREIITTIIHAPTGDNVKVAALDALTKTLGIDHATISHCHIDGSTDASVHHHYNAPEPEADVYSDDLDDATLSPTTGKGGL